MHMFTLEEIDPDINVLRACGYEQILEQGVSIISLAELEA